MTHMQSRRKFLNQAGISAAAANLMMNLPSLAMAGGTEAAEKKRLVIVFSPNGVIPKHFWP